MQTLQNQHCDCGQKASYIHKNTMTGKNYPFCLKHHKQRCTHEEHSGKNTMCFAVQQPRF